VFVSSFYLFSFLLFFFVSSSSSFLLSSSSILQGTIIVCVSCLFLFIQLLLEATFPIYRSPSCLPPSHMHPAWWPWRQRIHLICAYLCINCFVHTVLMFRVLCWFWNHIPVVCSLQALENEIGSHEPQLMSVVSVGDDLVQHRHFGADRIQERLQEILRMWQHLIDAAAYRRKRLEEAVDFHQVSWVNSFRTWEL
jgi:hypothetical protein